VPQFAGHTLVRKFGKAVAFWSARLSIVDKSETVDRSGGGENFNDLLLGEPW